MRGRKPLPTALKVVKGTERPGRKNEDEPKIPVSIPKPPDYLEGAAVDIFVHHARLLARMRVMTDADVTALAICARALEEAREADKKVQELGMVMRSPKTNSIMHNPYKKVRDDAEAKALRILSEFGLTPSSRARVKAT